MVLLLSVVSTIIFFSQCNQTAKTAYLNHHDSVAYVGMAACAACHDDKHASFMHTGMGLSFGRASKAKSAAVFGKDHIVMDSASGLCYWPYWRADSLYIKEFLIEGTDTIHQLDVYINYIVGSGQHTNSHLLERNGYVFQAPITFYTQEGKWHLAPGFENGNNSRFGRILDVECMSCHNSMPKLDQKSNLHFSSIGQGIDCERCHGPGELHVKLRQQGKGVDTKTKVDPTIVNPAKLSLDLQLDVCQRCHLQGLNVLKEGKKFTDFKPGMKLSDVFDVFLPEYEGEGSAFDMANHSARFQKSKCYLNKGEQEFNCISCHNPHISVKQTNFQLFNQQCLKCHKENKYTNQLSNAHSGNCVQCHMPAQSSTDILHVQVHDHFIRIPEKQQNTEQMRKLLGLYAVNNKEVSHKEMARAYLEYWEKFDKNPFYLNKAYEELKVASDNALWLKYYFLKKEYGRVIEYSDKLENKDYWQAYMIGASYLELNDEDKARAYYIMSYKLNSENSDIGIKLCKLLLKRGEWKQAESIASELLSKFRNNGLLWNIMASAQARQGSVSLANSSLERALKLEPLSMEVWETAFNLALVSNNANKISYWGKKILARNPAHPHAQEIAERISSQNL